MKSKLMLKLLPAALFAAMTATSVQALDFHGYVRAGAGTTLGNGGGSMACFKLPGAESKYRLGNECETYGEMTFDQSLFSAKDGVKFDYHLRLATVNDFDKGQTGWQPYDSKNSTIASAENYIDAKNLPFLNGGTVWAGKRFYERNDVHISDFFYWNDSGYGAGVMDIPVGSVKLSYALMRSTFTAGEATTRHDFRVGGINTPGGGNVTVGVQFNKADTSIPNRHNGWALTGQHFQGNLLGGYNKIALQYGSGSASSLNLSDPDNGANSDRKTWRLTEQLQWQVSPEFSGMATAVWQKKKDEYTWFSMGVRPVWHFSDYFKLQGELGYDSVKPAAAGSSTANLTKFTIAPTIVAGRGFWARPEMRVFLTHANWNSAAKNQMGGVAGGTGGRFGANTSGNTAGFQVEAWW